MPAWARDVVSLYESGAANQFILYGNVNDEIVLPLNSACRIGSLADFLLHVLMPSFDVILSYDVGNGIRVEQGAKIFSEWPFMHDMPDLPKAPRAAIETLTRYLRYCANLANIGRDKYHIGCYIKTADLVAPNAYQGLSNDVNALATLVRDWSSESDLLQHSLATFLIVENLNDLHPIIANNPRVSQIQIPLPTENELQTAFAILAPSFPTALSKYSDKMGDLAQSMTGATLSSVDSLLKVKEHSKQPIAPNDMVQLKKQLVEKDANGLIEFIESTKSLDDLSGQEKIKAWLRQDIALWNAGDLAALPMGYLLCGPVGTGKTYMAECLAGEAGVPVVKLQNFRDKWVGSTEGNLEKIFRLVHALGRCYVFIDEADQALGRRQSDADDSGVSNRVYSMMAAEMSDTNNRGKIIWVLASSRPDLIEVDLKRPGRIDVKIPIFPTTTPEEGFALLCGLCKRRGLDVPSALTDAMTPLIPNLLTPGAAEALAVKVYRRTRTESCTPIQALEDCLKDYLSPVPPETMAFQIRLAVAEASDSEFVPKEFQLPAAGP